MGALAGTKETHPAHQSSVSYAGGRENDLLAWRKVIRVVNLLRISYAHRLKPLDYLLGRRYFAFIDPQPVGIENQTRLNLAVQTFYCRRGQYAFGRTADTDTGVNVCACNRG